MKKQENTKELFLEKALHLFAERGYEAVTVSQIAKAVGCTAPALYKHYSSKQELFEAIIVESTNGYNSQMEALQVDFSKHPEQKAQYISMTEDEQIERAKQLFLHTVHDKWPSAFRKLITIEQFHMPQLAKLYNERYIESQYKQHEVLFELWMEAGKLKSADAKTLSILYLSPIIVLINVCDREMDKEEWALHVIENHIKEFNKLYRI